jgi:hypothetical protein
MLFLRVVPFEDVPSDAAGPVVSAEMDRGTTFHGDRRSYD